MDFFSTSYNIMRDVIFYMKNISDYMFSWFFSNIDLHTSVFYESDTINFRFTTIVIAVTSLK